MLLTGNAAASEKAVGDQHRQRIQKQHLTQLHRVMKLTSIILIIACLQVSARGYAQKITLTEKNASLEKVFGEIKKQTEYKFFYDDNLIVNAKPVNIEVVDASLDQVMEICLKGQGLIYEIIDKVIIVKQRPSSILQVVQNSLSVAPLIDIKGKVVNEKGDPVDGVTVTIKGTKTATSTDVNGEFYLKTVDQNAILIFTSVNMEAFEVNVNKKEDLLVNLKTKISALQDVIINKGYYTTSQRLNTGNVSRVTSETISKQPISNPLEALEGRMPGVYIQQTSGVSGSGFNVEIRGRNSLRTTPTNNGNLPFYIIDGVPFTSTSLDAFTGIGGQIAPFVSPLNSIDPAEIESIEVLKDADATAIYGSRGANGVVLITTKKGKAGKTKVDINLYTGFGQVTKMMDLLNSQQYLQMRHEAFRNDGVTTLPANAYDLNGKWDTTSYTDWQKKLIGGTARITNIQASVSGGNQNTQFLIGGGYFHESTVFPGSFSDQKISGHFNLNHCSENKKFATTLSVSYANDYNNLPKQDPTNRAITFAPVAPPIYNSNGALNWANGTWQNGGANPFSLFSQPYKGNTTNLIANEIISYQLVQGLQMKISLGYNNIQMQQNNVTPISSQNPASNPTGSGNYSNNSSNSWIIEPQIEYHRNLKNGKLSILLGTTLQQNINQFQSFFASGFTSDALLDDMLAAPNVFPASYTYSKYRYNALFGRFNYNWQDKYMINITGRRDGSSRFGPGSQFGNFGAIGAGWIFSNESFLQKSLPFLSYGKIKTSYGITGSDQIPDYGFLDTYASTNYPYNGTSGLTINRLFNPDYGWETNTKVEGAIDLGFLKDQILLSISYYNNRSSNQLVGYPLPTITGQSSLPFYNLPATVQNTGWEFELTTLNIKSEFIKWTTSINLTIPRNTLISYPNIQASSYANTYTVGQSIYIKKAYQFTGTDPKTGIYTFEDVNKDGKISSPNDLQAIKIIGRDYYGGIDNNISYKGFQFDIFAQFVKQTGVNYLSAFSSPGTLSNQPQIVLNRWKALGDITTVQKYSQTGVALTAYNNAKNTGDSRISDASFIRLKNVSLSYQFPANWISRAKIKSLKIYIQGQNLITITNYLGLDPETQSFQSIPPLKLLTAGIHIIL